MILSGILHSSLGGFTVVRGVAPLGDLARCSGHNPAYQRNLIETHREEIERFLSDRKYLFFPEVVLSASLQFDFNAYKGKRAVNPIADIFAGKGFESNVNGLAVRVLKMRVGKQVLGASPAPEIAFIELPEAQLTKGLALFRIDGNHRLSAAQDTKQGDERYNLPTPFCVVLHDDVVLSQRFEKVVFHNINAKQIPLTSEENLRLILDVGDDQLFDDKVLLESPSFGPPYYLARKLFREMDARYLAGLRKPLENPYTLSLALTQFLRAKDEAVSKADSADALATQLPRLRDALRAVNEIYEKPHRQSLREAGCQGVLVAFVHFALKNEGRQLASFKRWVVSNRIDRLAPTSATRNLGYHYHLGRTQAVDAASLVEVFESILTARSRDVFVSMEFGSHTDAVFRAIETAIEKVNDVYRLQALNLALRPIRIDRVNVGHSYTIDTEILKVIDGAGLLIADLTQSNKNVYHEVGFLMGLNQGRGDAHDNFILIADKHKIKDNDIGFNLRAWQQVRFNDTLELTNKLVESLETRYQLGKAPP
jgi:hypothetical protein